MDIQEINNKTMRYKVTSNNIHIEDSYQASKTEFSPFFKYLQINYPDCDVFKQRSMFSMTREWATHNALYAMRLFRQRTKDVDINCPLKWYMKVLYAVFGTLVWIFIK